MIWHIYLRQYTNSLLQQVLLDTGIQNSHIYHAHAVVRSVQLYDLKLLTQGSEAGFPICMEIRPKSSKSSYVEGLAAHLRPVLSGSECHDNRVRGSLDPKCKQENSDG